MTGKFSKTILGLILALAFVVRVVGISSHPVGFTQDEAALGYDAYSLLKTGADQWGKHWPLALRSFGDFKMPLYSYLAIPSIAVFGLNEIATRLPNAILGTLAVLFTYLMCDQLFKNPKKLLINNYQLTIGEVAAFLLAISPWHVSLSRGAFEANLTTFLMPAGIWLYYLGLKKPQYLIMSAISFGLNLFSYHSARIFTLFLVPVLILITYNDVISLWRNNFRKLFPTFLVTGVFLLLLVNSLFTGAGNRASDVTIFNPTDKWEAVSDRRYEAVLQGLQTEYARIFSNKISYLFHRFSSNYLSYISPNFLFTEGVSEWSYGMIPGRGVLYTLEIIPLLFAVSVFFKNKKDLGLKFLFSWVVISIVPASLSKGAGGSGTRAATMMPAIQILSAFGVVTLFGWLKDKFNVLKLNNLALGIVLGLYLFSFAFFVEDYLYHEKVRGAKAMQYGMKNVIQRMDSVSGDYNEIILSRSLSVPNIWVQFYLKIDPILVQQASRNWLDYEKENLVSIDQMGSYSLGKYVFGAIEKDKLPGEKGMLVVGKPDEFKAGQEALKTINFPDGVPAYLIVDTNKM